MSLSYDAFSYAMVMYELFSHEPPFAEVPHLLVQKKIVEGEVSSESSTYYDAARYVIP